MLKNNQTLKIRKAGDNLEIELETVHPYITYRLSAIVRNIENEYAQRSLIMKLEAIIYFLQKKSEDCGL